MRSTVAGETLRWQPLAMSQARNSREPGAGSRSSPGNGSSARLVWVASPFFHFLPLPHTRRVILSATKWREELALSAAKGPRSSWTGAPPSAGPRPDWARTPLRQTSSYEAPGGSFATGATRPPLRMTIRVLRKEMKGETPLPQGFRDMQLGGCAFSPHPLSYATWTLHIQPTP